MLHVKVIIFSALATVVQGSLHPDRKSITKCSTLKTSLMQMLWSLEPNSPVLFAVPPSGNSGCSETILTSVAQESVWPLLIFTKLDINDRTAHFQPLRDKVSLTILVGNPDQIIQSIDDLRLKYVWDADSIVITILENDNRVDILRTIGFLQQAFVRRLRVLTSVSDSVAAVWSEADPTATVCGRSGNSATLLGIWRSSSNGTAPSRNFLYKLPPAPTLENVRCTFRVYVFIDAPFSLDERPPRGLDIELFKLLAERVGFELEFIAPGNNFTPPAHSEDNVLLNALHLLNVDPVDSMVGCILPTKLRSQHLTIVQIYYQNAGHIWIREIRRHKLPVPVSTAYAWAVLFILWMMIAWLIRPFRSQSNQGTSYLTSWGSMLEVPSPWSRLPHSTNTRVFLSLFLMCTFIANLDIRTNLMSRLAVSKVRPEFQSYDELLKSNAVIGFSERVFLKIFAEGVEGTEYEKAVFHYYRTESCGGPLWADCWKKFITTGKLTTGTSLALFTSEARIRSMPSTLFRQKLYPYLDQPSFPVMCSMVLRKGNPWAAHFRRLIDLSAAADLNTAWMRTYRPRRNYSAVPEEIGYSVLRMKNVALPFQILVVGLSVATGSLCIERFINQYKQRIDSLLQPSS